MTTEEIFKLAFDHAFPTGKGKVNSSAAFCIDQSAIAAFRKDDAAARRWAIRSLAHSVGILHPAYKQATA